MDSGAGLKQLCNTCGSPIEDPTDYRCSSCYAPVRFSTVEDLVKDILDSDILCEICFNPIQWDEDQCAHCYTEWSQDYWNDRWVLHKQATYIDTPDPEPEPNDINYGINYVELAQEWEQYTLCCQQKLRDCTCELAVPGEAVFNMGAEVYSEQSICVNCVWCMTTVCPELRNVAMVKTHAEANGYTVEIPTIDGCAKFLLDEDSL